MQKGTRAVPVGAARRGGSLDECTRCAHRAMASNTLTCLQRIHWRFRSMKAAPDVRMRSAISSAGGVTGAPPPQRDPHATLDERSSDWRPTPGGYVQTRQQSPIIAGDKPTSMIGLCQEGKSSPDALPEERGCKFFLILRRVCWPLGRGSSVRENQTSICCPSHSAEQKIEFVFSCQSRNLSTGAFRACALSPSRLNGKTWQATRRRNPPCLPPRFTQRRSYSSPAPETPAGHGRPP